MSRRSPRVLARRLVPTPLRRPVGRLWRRVRRRAADRVDDSTASSPTAPLMPPWTMASTLDLRLYDVPTDPVRQRALLDGAFGHGYLVHAPGPVSLPGFLDLWEHRQVAGLTLRTAPRTVVTVAGGGTDDTAVVLFGHPVDVDHGSVDAPQIAARLHGRLRDVGVQGTVREAAYLAGRWTLLLVERGADVHPPRLTVVPDTMGSQPVFWAADGSSVTLASAGPLVALARGLEPDPRAVALTDDILTLHPQGVTYLPGTLTHFSGVRPLVPNCLLEVALGTPPRVRHTRFWPFEPRVERTDLDAVVADFRERMRAHLRLVAELGPLGWSLTGGEDSRVTLAHAPDPLPEGMLAFTYLNPRDAVSSPGAAQDVFDANLLAYRLGIPHRVLRWRHPPRSSVFAALHRATYPVSHSSHGAGFAMWADLPHDLVEIQSNGGEIGTRSTRPRRPTPLTPGKMAGLWMGDDFAERRPYPEIFEDYLAHTQMTEERLLGHDHHDLVYWELRMGKWGWTKFLLGDFSHRIMLPFNDRALLETMLSLPEEQRITKALYARVLEASPLLRLTN